MDILRMLQQLEEIAVERPSHIGPLYWRVDVEEISMHIAKIRASLPQEVKQAASVTRESEHIINAAKEDADSVLGRARAEAEKIIEEANAKAKLLEEQGKLEQSRLVSENEVLKLAKAQAEEVMNEAQKQASPTRRGADDYAYQVLNHIEAVLNKTLRNVEAGKEEISGVPKVAAVPIESRERLKV